MARTLRRERSPAKPARTPAQGSIEDAMSANAMAGLVLDALEASARGLLRGGSAQDTAARLMACCQVLRGTRAEIKDHLGRAWADMETARRQTCGRGMVLA